MRPFAKGGFVPANQNRSPYINEGESLLSNRMKEETHVTEDAEFEVIEPKRISFSDVDPNEPIESVHKKQNILCKYL